MRWKSVPSLFPLFFLCYEVKKTWTTACHSLSLTMQNMDLCPRRDGVGRDARVVARVVRGHVVDLEPSLELRRHLALDHHPALLLAWAGPTLQDRVEEPLVLEPMDDGTLLVGPVRTLEPEVNVARKTEACAGLHVLLSRPLDLRAGF